MNSSQSSVIDIRGRRIGEGMPKLCVPMTGMNLVELMEEADQILEAGSIIDMVEWRVDWYEGIQEKKKEVREGAIWQAAAAIRKKLGTLPLLATIRTEEEGGQVSLTGEDYRAVNFKLAEQGCVDLIDVQVFFGQNSSEDIYSEQELADTFSIDISVEMAEHIAALQASGISVIGSWHNFGETPSEREMEERLLSIEKSGADIGKMAVMPFCVEDVKRLIRVTRRAREQKIRCPLVTMSMSGLGVVSRLAGEYYGSCITFGCMGRPSAAGQIDVGTLRVILQALHERKNLVMTGFMGSGKTTQGMILAQALDCELIDTDQMIEQEEGMTIGELFARKGEPYFRQKETQTLHRLGKEKQGELVVIATGGGLPMRQENHSLMRKLGLVVFLEVGRESVLKRLKGDTSRPLLAGPNPAAKVDKLLAERAPLYEQAADVILRTD